MTTPDTRNSQQGQLLIGISSCLLGNPVRYDGGHKRHNIIKSYICSHLACLDICPEMAIDLGAPRPTIQLICEDTQQQDRDYHVIAWQSETRRDLTASLRGYAEHIAQTHTQLCGFIFKARSPSCAVKSAGFYNRTEQLLGTTSGIFAGHLCQLLGNEFPVCEESDIADRKAAERFVTRVRQFARNR